MAAGWQTVNGGLLTLRAVRRRACSKWWGERRKGGKSSASALGLSQIRQGCLERSHGLHNGSPECRDSLRIGRADLGECDLRAKLAQTDSRRRRTRCPARSEYSPRPREPVASSSKSRATRERRKLGDRGSSRNEAGLTLRDSGGDDGKESERGGTHAEEVELDKGGGGEVAN